MDNKNEKTFADLFSSVDNDTVDENITDGDTRFDNLASKENSFENNNISFGDISEIAVSNTEKVNNNDVLEHSQVNDGTSFEDLLSNKEMFQEETVNVDSKSNQLVEEMNSMNNLVSLNDNSISVEDKSVVDNNPFLENKVEVENNNIVEQNNLFFNDDSSLNQDVEVNNNENVTHTEEVIREVNPFFDNKTEVENDNFVSQDNLFFNDNNSHNQDIEVNDENVTHNEEVIEGVNPFFDNNKTDSVVLNNNEQVEGVISNQLLIENEKMKLSKEQEKKVVESVSPFFQESSEQLDKIGNNIFDNKISFDQTKNINSKLDKIDLSGTKNFNVKMVKKKVPLTKFIVGVISYAFFIFLVLILVTLLAYVLDIKIRAAKGDYSAPKFNAYVVLTGSMLPEIQVKDVVVTKKVDADALKVGDIITFASSDSRFTGTIITHRILKKNQDADGNITFQTKGDNNNVADSALVQPNNIYGKVIVKIPKLGYLQDFLATQGGWIIVILLPCVTVISYDVVKLAKGIKNKNKIKVIK